MNQLYITRLEYMFKWQVIIDLRGIPQMHPWQKHSIVEELRHEKWRYIKL